MHDKQETIKRRRKRAENGIEYHSKPYDPMKRKIALRKSPEALNPGGVSQPRRQDKAA